MSRTRIPVSNAVTAMEVWLLACMLLVFLSLVEYAIILRRIVIFTRETNRVNKRNEEIKKNRSNGNNSEYNKRVSERIDRGCP